MARLAGLLAMLLLAAPAAGAELRGRVELLARGGKGPARGSDVRQAVAWFEPAAGGARPVPGSFQIVTRKKELIPRVLAVPRGSRVRFPNEDPILHNVFSVSPGNAFDLGLANQGPGREKRFDTPGVVRVFCNVHHAMVAYVLVLDTPHFASPGPDGGFALAGLPPGPGRLTVWHEQAEPWTAEVRLPAAAPVAVRLEVTRQRFPAHLNKTGKPYPGSSRDRYRQ